MCFEDDRSKKLLNTTKKFIYKYTYVYVYDYENTDHYRGGVYAPGRE